MKYRYVKVCIVVCAFFAFAVSLSAQDKELSSAEKFEALFPTLSFESVQKSGRIQHGRYYADDMNPKFLPAEPKARSIAKVWTRKTGLIIESVYLYQKKETDHTVSIPLLLRSISHLEGVQYYSPSRKKMRTLYETAYAIESPDTKKRIADPKIEASPQKVFTLQKDLTFGENMYEYTFIDGEGVSAFCSENLTSLRKIIRLVPKRCLNVALVVYDLGDYIALYGIARADVGQYPLFKNKMMNSISARSDALYEWFVKEYEKGEKK